MADLSIKIDQIITEEQFFSLQKMMNSPDKENINLALSIIDRFDPETNFIPLILLMKYCNPTIDLWEKNVKRFYLLTAKHKLDQKGVSYTLITKTYKKIGILNETHEKILIKSALENITGLIDSFQFGKLESVSVKYKDKEIISLTEFDG